MSRPNRGTRLAEAFWSKVRKTDGCWFWEGAVSNSGYGSIRVNGVVKKAHRVAYMLQFDDFNEESQVLHRCDTPLCVRGDHLFQGSQCTNVNDMAQKGRHPMVKMSTEQVIEAKATYDKGRISLAQLAKRYNCSAASLCLLFNGKSRREEITAVGNTTSD